MVHSFICNCCLKRVAGKPITELSMRQYKACVPSCVFPVDLTSDQMTSGPCPTCHSTDTRKLASLEASYVRGYGYLDKKGVTNDMHLHTMLTGTDPYKEHRKAGDSKELISKLRRNKDHRPKRSDVFMR